MSKLYEPSYADPLGAIIKPQGLGVMFATGTTVPTDATAGYMKGCIFIDRDASEGAQVYVNVGTVDSSNFDALVGITDTEMAFLAGVVPGTGAVSKAAVIGPDSSFSFPAGTGAVSFLANGLATAAGTGFTSGTGTIHNSSVMKIGTVIKTEIVIDLTGLGTSTTDGDIIGVGVGPSHLGQITTARNGVIDAMRVTCLEAPATGADDLDFWAATEATGKFDDAGGATLTETVLVASGAAWTNGRVLGSTDVPPANSYLYIVNGEAGTVGTFTAGKFVIELWGH
jgi:hypothetical protein